MHPESSGILKLLKSCLLKSLISIVFLSAVFPHKSLGESLPPIYIDGKRVTFPDTKPYLRGPTIMVPLRFVFETAGAEVQWNNGNIRVTRRDINIEMRVGDKTVVVNGVPRVIPVGPEIQNNRSYLPLDTIFKLMGAHVVCDMKCAIYINKVQTITFKKDGDLLTGFSAPSSLLLLTYRNLSVPEPFMTNSKLLIVVDQKKKEEGCIGIKGREIYYSKRKYSLNDMVTICGQVGIWKDGVFYGGSKVSNGFVFLVV